jgi:hypothetical protein
MAASRRYAVQRAPVQRMQQTAYAVYDQPLFVVRSSDTRARVISVYNVMGVGWLVW